VCRADVAPNARVTTERLLLDIRQALADQDQVDPDTMKPLRRAAPGDLRTRAASRAVASCQYN
jgi:hypothetical protein